jgi:hypothetical protein
MENIKKALAMLNNDWGENWDVVVDIFGEELAGLLDKAISEAENPVKVVKRLPCSAHAAMPECDICDDKGYIIYSCCGNDITDQLPDNDLCPECKEHCGDGDKEICECKEN